MCHQQQLAQQFLSRLPAATAEVTDVSSSLQQVPEHAALESIHWHYPCSGVSQDGWDSAPEWSRIEANQIDSAT